MLVCHLSLWKDFLKHLSPVIKKEKKKQLLTSYGGIAFLGLESAVTWWHFWN